MLHISDLRNNKEQIISSLKIKNFDAENLVNSAIAKDDERKAIQQKSDDLLSQQNKIAKEIGVLFKTGKVEKANDLKQQSIKIKKESQETISLQNKIEEELLSIIVQIPNVPHKSVVKGNSDQDNEILNEFGDKPNLIKDALPHWELAEKYNLIDFKLGNKITGSGFPVFKGKGAKLQRALISFF